MKKSLLSIVFCVAFALPAFAQLTKAEVESFLKLIQVESIKQVIFSINTSSVLIDGDVRENMSIYKNFKSIKIEFKENSLIMTIDDSPKLIPYQSIKFIDLYKRDGTQFMYLVLND
jgi:hypothetical protein